MLDLFASETDAIAMCTGTTDWLPDWYQQRSVKIETECTVMATCRYDRSYERFGTKPHTASALLSVQADAVLMECSQGIGNRGSRRWVASASA